MALSLLLRCTDLIQTREFYGSVLGFTLVDSAENTLTVEKHGGRLVFTERDLWSTLPVLSGTVYFTVPDAEDVFLRVKDKTAIAWPLQRMPYGSYEFGLIDCNGYVLAFQQAA